MQTTRPHEGTINARFLLNAYCHGFFPMANPETSEIEWFSPDPRGVIELDEFKISRSLRQALRKNVFEIRVNTRFEEVIRNCAQRKETWISEEIIRSYLDLYSSGFAHSVEAWNGRDLAGGLYGVAIGGAFFGESMFSLETNASKIALVWLVARLKERHFQLLDTQFLTEHLARFGAREMSREQYLERLQKAVTLQCRFQ